MNTTINNTYPMLLSLAVSACLFLALNQTSLAQTPGDSLTIKKTLGTNGIYQEGKILRIKEVLEIMKFNETALNDMKKAKNNQTWATIFGALGGGFIGWPLGVAIAGGDPPWALAGIGAGLIVIGIPFNTKYNRYSEDAVDHYNRVIGSESSRERIDLKLGMTRHGIGLTLKF